VARSEELATLRLNGDYSCALLSFFQSKGSGVQIVKKIPNKRDITRALFQQFLCLASGAGIDVDVLPFAMLIALFGFSADAIILASRSRRSRRNLLRCLGTLAVQLDAILEQSYPGQTHAPLVLDFVRFVIETPPDMERIMPPPGDDRLHRHRRKVEDRIATLDPDRISNALMDLYGVDRGLVHRVLKVATWILRVASLGLFF